MANYELIPNYVLEDTKQWIDLSQSVGRVVISGINMLPLQTASISVSIAAEQTVAGYTFSEAATSIATSTFATTITTIMSTLATIGTVIAIVMVVQNYLSAWSNVDSLKRKRDKVLNMFRRIKRLNRIADVNNVIYKNVENFLQDKYAMLTNYENTLNDNNLIVRKFISAKTNTYLLSNPIINFLRNEQNVLDIITKNNYKYIEVISFKDYIKDLDILELDKIRIAQADTLTTKTYIDNLNALLILIDKLDNYSLYPQVRDDIKFIKNNINILLEQTKKTYIEQISSQDITEPLKMLEEITNDIPFLDLSAQDKDIGGLSLYPNEYISNDIPILLNTLNKKDLMILVFNNIYIEKFIKLMINYYTLQSQLSNDLRKYINSAVNTFNLLSQIISLKSLQEKYYNQQLSDNIYVDRYRIFTYLKNLFLNKTITFLKNFKFEYKKSNNVNVKNSLKVNNLIFDFNLKEYDFENFVYYFDFDTDDENQKISNIDINTIKINDLQEKYFNYISDIKQELSNYGIKISTPRTITFAIGSGRVTTTVGLDIIENFIDLIYYIYNILQQIQDVINTSYENCKYKTYTYSFDKFEFNEKLDKIKQTNDIRLKECIYIGDEVNKQIDNLQSELYNIRQDYKYEYSVFSDLFLSETSYFLFELFTKIETVTNSSVAIIKQINISVTNNGYTINFYDILYTFFTKYLNNYSGYIYSKNKYLDKLVTITQCNFISTLQIACDYKSIDVKQNELKSNIDKLNNQTISEQQLSDIINLSSDNEVSDILASQEVPQITKSNNNSLIKIGTVILTTALLSN